jgi:hypothetical protein
MPTYGFQAKNDSGKYLITDQTTSLSFVKRCIGFDEDTIKMELGHGFDGAVFSFDVTNCPGTPIPFFTCPVVGKLYAVTQVYPVGTNRWTIELATDSKPDDRANWTIPSVVAVPPTGFSMTLRKFFEADFWQDQALPYTSPVTIANVSQVNKGYDPSLGYRSDNDGISRGHYIMCHDTAIYNTSTNSFTQSFEQDYVPSDRRIKFNNILRSGQFLDYKANGSGNKYGIFQFNGGQTNHVTGSGSTNLTPTAATELNGAAQLRIYHKSIHTNNYYRPFISTNNSHSDYISSTARTRIYLTESDYRRVLVGQYVNYLQQSTLSYSSSPFPEGTWTGSNVGWKEVLTKAYSSSLGYYIEISGNFPVPDSSYLGPWYKLRNVSDEKISCGGAYWYWFFISVRGFPNSSTTQQNELTAAYLTADYTNSNTDWFALALDGSVTPRTIGWSPYPFVPSTVDYSPNNEGDMTLSKASNVWPDINNSTTLRPSLHRLPIAEHGGNYASNKEERVFASFYMYANLPSWKHHIKGHTMDRSAIVKGQTNYARVSKTVIYDREQELSGTNLSAENGKRLTITNTPEDHLEFNQSFSAVRTPSVPATGESWVDGHDLKIFTMNNKWIVPESDGTIDETKIIQAIYNGAYLTAEHNISTANMPNNSFLFKEKKIWQSVNYLDVLTNEITESDIGCDIPSPIDTGSTYGLTLAFGDQTDNTIDFSSLNSGLTSVHVEYIFYVKIGNAVNEASTVLNIKRPSSKSVALTTNFSLAHRTVTKAYPFTTFIQPTNQFVLSATIRDVTATREISLYSTHITVRDLNSNLFKDNTDMAQMVTNGLAKHIVTADLGTSNSGSYAYYPWIDEDWYDLQVLESENPFMVTTFITVVRESGTEVGRAYSEHIHSQTPKKKMFLTKLFDTKAWIQADDESMWKHDGFRKTPNTVQTRKRGFVPGVACIQGIPDNIGGWHVQPFYFTEDDPENDADSKSWRTMSGAIHGLPYFDNQHSETLRYQLCFQPPYKLPEQFDPAYYGANVHQSPPYSVYNRTASTGDKWVADYLTDGVNTITGPDQVTLDSTARGLLRANYGHLNSSKTIKERLIWKGVTVATSSTIGGISNPVTVGNYEYTFNFADSTYTDHYTFVPVSKVGAYNASDFDGFGPAAFDDGTIPELFVFSEPNSAPAPFDDEGLQILSADGIKIFDSRIRPLLITDTASITNPSTPVTINCSSLRADNSLDDIQPHASVFNPTNTSTFTDLTFTSSPAFFYNPKTLSEKQCTKTLSETVSKGVNLSTDILHDSTYWAVYKGGIGRQGTNNTMTSGYVTVKAGAYYIQKSQTYSSTFFSYRSSGVKIDTAGSPPSFTNLTVNNVDQTVISIDTNAYIGTTYTVTASSGGGTIVRLSGEDRNGTFTNVANKTLSLFTGDRLKITFHTSNYTIKTAQELSQDFNVNSGLSINNNGTIQQIHFVPDIPGTYFYTRTGITNTNSQGQIVVTTG